MHFHKSKDIWQLLKVVPVHFGRWCRPWKLLRVWLVDMAPVAYVAEDGLVWHQWKERPSDNGSLPQCLGLAREAFGSVLWGGGTCSSKKGEGVV